MPKVTPFMVGSLLVLAGGCPDPSDSGNGDPVTGVAAVMVTGAGPVEGLDVVFHKPDGTVLAHAQTDASGKASASIESGALVTVGRYVSAPSARWELTTIAGVEIGDDLVLGRPSAGSSAGTAAIGFTGPASSATEYRVDVGCNVGVAFSVGTPVSVPFYSTCGSTLDALTLARGAGSALVAWTTALDLSISGAAPGQTAAGTSAAWRTDFGSLALTLDNPPASGAAATATLTPRRNGIRFSSSATSQTATLAPPASANLSLPFAQDFASSARLEVRVTHQSSTDDSRFIDNGADFAARTLDLATALPPRVTGAQLVETGGVLSASWSLGAADAGLDATTLSASWNDAAGRHDWHVVVPPGVTQFAFPVVPAALGAYLPVGGTAPSWFEVTVDDVSTTAGYDAFRAANLGLVYAIPEAGSWSLRRSSTVTF
jgi:hypothetical protein